MVKWPTGDMWSTMDIFLTIQQPKRPPIGRSCLEEKLATTGASEAWTENPPRMSSNLGAYNGLLTACWTTQSDLSICPASKAKPAASKLICAPRGTKVFHRDACEIGWNRYMHICEGMYLYHPTPCLHASVASIQICISDCHWLDMYIEVCLLCVHACVCSVRVSECVWLGKGTCLGSYVEKCCCNHLYSY